MKLTLVKPGDYIRLQTGKTFTDNYSAKGHYKVIRVIDDYIEVEDGRGLEVFLSNQDALDYFEVEPVKQELTVTVQDNVNHPAHYTQGGIECIDAMEAAYGTEAVIMFCMCNAFKYQWRFNKKNGREDILKCQWYQNKMVELQNKLNKLNEDRRQSKGNS